MQMLGVISYMFAAHPSLRAVCPTLRASLRVYCKSQ
nr:MAG TPA: hypothetical protein [Bacteriophage sp.]